MCYTMISMFHKDTQKNAKYVYGRLIGGHGVRVSGKAKMTVQDSTTYLSSWYLGGTLYNYRYSVSSWSEDFFAGLPTSKLKKPRDWWPAYWGSLHITLSHCQSVWWGTLSSNPPVSPFTCSYRAYILLEFATWPITPRPANVTKNSSSIFIY